MKNLKLVTSSCFDQFRSSLSKPVGVAVDYDTGHVYVVTCECIHTVDLQSFDLIATVNLVTEGHIKPGVNIIGIQHLPDQFAVCVCTSSGDVFLWNVTTNQVECVGSVESGLLAMAWSPDHELVVFVTGQKTLIIMSKDFDPVCENDLQPSDFGEAKPITVGWGKKETQFHGSEGKAAAKIKASNVNPALPWDDLKPRVSWRGDAQHFVVSSISEQTGARILRVWTKEGVLHSTSEAVDGLEQALAWKPSGSLIASSQRKPNKHDIVFFELNGLRHGEFTLPFNKLEVKVKEVMWNIDSTVLMLWCEDIPNESDEDKMKQSYVQLWTINNYHWYLKQSLKFNKGEDQPATMIWDPMQSHQLIILCQSGRLLRYTWVWNTDCSSFRSSESLSNTIVFDSDKVLVTPFRNTVVPPPMCAYYIKLPSAAEAVMHSPDSNSFSCVYACDKINIYEFSDKEESSKIDGLNVQACGGTGFVVRCVVPTSCTECQLQFSEQDEMKYPLKYHHFTIVSSTKILFVSQNNTGSCSVLHEANLRNSQWRIENSTDVEGLVICIAVNPTSGKIAVQNAEGNVFEYNSGILMPWCTLDGSELIFRRPCYQMAVCEMGDEEVVIGLTERFRLYVNEVEVASNCTSFAVHDEFLLLTTHTHTCRCICRKTKVKDLSSLSDGKAHPFDESIRRVERGSKIVAAVPYDTKLILQMPRGNLETIHPRALVLSAIRRNLDKLNFKEAMVLMRKHRINMNLIHDHNPELFFKHIEEFLLQIETANLINLFLTELQEEDVTASMYTVAYNRPENVPEAGTSKVDKICDAVGSALEKINKNKLLLSILTAHVKKSKPEMDIALQKIMEIRDDPGGVNLPVNADEALRYLLYLVDVNELFDVALGTYDFGLVLMVAERSQKDPKEYLPFLNNLKKMEENYMKYSIDKHLKRYSKALKHIGLCGKEHFNECMALVKDHRLYSEALKLYSKDSQEYKDIAVAYGDYLMTKKHYEEAGIVYIKSCEWQSALNAFEKDVNWRQCMCMASRLKMPSNKVIELGRKLASSLKLSGSHGDAAILLEQYAQDTEEAIETLIEGQKWEEALRLMHKYDRMDFLETTFLPALKENHSSYTSLIETTKSDFDRYRKRLIAVRAEKERERLEIMEGNYNDADADLFSDTSSATGESVQSSTISSTSQRSSKYSVSTAKSSRNRKKAERKKWSLKEGSTFEDLALVDALAKLIQRSEALKDEISPLLKMLVLYNFEDEATNLQKLVTNLSEIIEKSIPDIWENEESETNVALGPDSTANSISQAVRHGRNVIRSELEKESVLKMPPTIDKNKKWTLNMLKEKH